MARAVSGAAGESLSPAARPFADADFGLSHFWGKAPVA